MLDIHIDSENYLNLENLVVKPNFEKRIKQNYVFFLKIFASQHNNYTLWWIPF